MKKHLTLLEARKALRMSLKDVSIGSHCCLSTISKCERQIEDPKPFIKSKLEKFFASYDITINWQYRKVLDYEIRFQDIDNRLARLEQILSNIEHVFMLDNIVETNKRK